MFIRFLVDERKNTTAPTYFLRMAFDAVMIATFFMVCYYLVFIVLPWKSVGEGNFASVIKLILIIVFFGWMTVARLARASAMQLKNMEFVTAAHALGASHVRVMLSHILPNALAPIIVAATLEVGGNILYEAALSFLGLGVQPTIIGARAFGKICESIHVHDSRPARARLSQTVGSVRVCTSKARRGWE